MLDLLTSRECLAAFLGAISAFLLEALRRWLASRRKDLAAGNETIFVLAQYYTVLRSCFQQGFEVRAKYVRQASGREPMYVEYIPIAANWNPALRIPIDRIGYLLHSHAPDVINRVAMAERDAVGLLGTLERRSALHVEFQRRATEVERAAQGAQIQFGVLEVSVGRDLSMQLRQVTEQLQQRLPEVCKVLKAAGDLLGDVLAFQFPLSRPIRFIDETATPMDVNRPLPRPALWRRLLRLANRPLRWKRHTAGPPNPDGTLDTPPRGSDG